MQYWKAQNIMYNRNSRHIHYIPCGIISVDYIKFKDNIMDMLIKALTIKQIKGNEFEANKSIKVAMVAT